MEKRTDQFFDERLRNLQLFKSCLNEAGTYLHPSEERLHNLLDAIIDTVQDEICNEDDQIDARM